MASNNSPTDTELSLTERLEAHLERYDRDREEWLKDRKALLGLVTAVNKTADTALQVANLGVEAAGKNTEATASLVEGVTTVNSLKKFIKWSGSSVILLSALAWIGTHAMDLFQKSPQ